MSFYGFIGKVDFFDGVSVIIRGTVFQLFVPDEMRGRVSFRQQHFVNSNNELGQFESGVTAAYMEYNPCCVIWWDKDLIDPAFSLGLKSQRSKI
ncbi:MAG: hypothetical protein IPN72_25130 [Saprospiraceae bacterium]|nr:hypothetical protein [Saprospiraceae bacterium]